MANGAPIPPDDQQPPPPPPPGPQPPGTIAIPGEIPPAQQPHQAPPQAPPQQPPQAPPETPQPAQAPGPSSLEDMENDPDFANLSPQDQQRVRQRLAPPKAPKATKASATGSSLQEMEQDPDFARLSPAEQQRVRHRMSEKVPGVERSQGLVPQFSGNLQQFTKRAKDAGYDIGIGSGYRTNERQQQLWDGAVRRYGSPEAARHWVAPPGRSMHNHGLAADLTFGSPAAREWAHQHAAEYGLNFPMGHEPWHIEPVGGRSLAGANAPPAGVPSAPAGGTAAPPAAPDEEEEPDQPEEPEEPTDEDLAPKSTFGNIYYRTIGRAAGAAQAMMYKLGVSEETPRELAIRRHREGGAPVFPEPVPVGKVQTALTMADLLAPAIDIYAPEVAIPIYGGAALVTHLSNSEWAGDITEAVVGTTQLVRDVAPTATAVYRQIKRKGALPAAYEAYHKAAGALGSAVERLWQDPVAVMNAAKDLMHQKANEARAAKAQAAAAEARASEANARHAAAAASRVEVPTQMAVGDVHYALDLPPDMPSRVAVGEQLQKLDVGEMTPETIEGTKEGGAKAVSSAMASRTKMAYAARDAKATEAGIAISNADGTLAPLKADIEAFVEAKLPTTFSLKEKKLMAELQDLLGVAVEDEKGDLVVHGPAASPFTDDRIPFAHLSDLYARLAKLRPAYGSREFDAYTKVVAGLKDVITALEGADPEVARLGSEARVLHGAEQEFNRLVKKPVMGARAPEEAAAFVFPMGKKVAAVTRAKKLMLNSAETQQEAYRLGWWRQLMESVTDKGSGTVDLGKLRTAWGQVPEDLRTLMSAGSTPEAGAKLNELLARQSKLTDVAHASDKEIEGLLSHKDLAARELKDAERKVTQAIREMEKIQQRGERVASSLGKPYSTMQFGRRAGMRYGAFSGTAAAGLLVPGAGPAARMAALGSMAWMMLKRPMTVAEALRTPRDTVNGARLAALLAATTQGWRGTTAGQPQQSPLDQPRAQVAP